MEPELCQYLSWDSDFFQMRIARLKASRLTPDTLHLVEEWCHEHRIDCLYFLAGLDDAVTPRVAEEHEFHLVDVRVSMDAFLTPRGPALVSGNPGCVRRFREEDVPALRQLAKVSHHDSRFYFDSRFRDDACDRLYEIWIDKSCRGWASEVFVADCGSGPVGYATVHGGDGSVGSLGLIAVDAAMHGRGLGRQLTAAVVDWCLQQRLDLVRVVTQGRNPKAMRMYTRCGFTPRSLELWYHRWFSPPKSGSQHG